MGRQLFLRHLSELTRSPLSNFHHIHSPEEAVISFIYTHTIDQKSQDTDLKLLATSVEDYPESNEYILYTDTDNTDSTILHALQILGPLLRGKSLPDAFLEISDGLLQAFSHGQSHNPILIEDDNQDVDNAFSDPEKFLEDAGSDEDDFSFNSSLEIPDTHTTLNDGDIASSATQTTMNILQMKKDLLLTKQAGFRVGFLGNIGSGGIICVSIRLNKLGISDEAMRAWGLSRKQYFILMLRFSQRYRNMEQIIDDESLSGRTQLQVGLCNAYKPSAESAFATFNRVWGPSQEDSRSHTTTGDGKSALLPFFIAHPLNDLLHHRFAKIVKFRDAYGFNWASAEKFVHEAQGKLDFKEDDVQLKDYHQVDKSLIKTVAPMLVADAMEGKALKDVPLPLLAMQFVLRHFVRCTEFCLVCHCKLEEDFEALKPYVCSRPLCLYQFMTLGFGPSMEWEILSQPYVVDLLVSFCYSAAHSGQLKQFPNGLNLNVPFLPHYNDDIASMLRSTPRVDQKGFKSPSASMHAPLKARLDLGQRPIVLTFSDTQTSKEWRQKNWLAIKLKHPEGYLHFQIREVNPSSLILEDPFFVKSKNSIESLRSSSLRPAGDMPPLEPTEELKEIQFNLHPSSEVDCYPYSCNFDTLSDLQKNHAIMTLLDTIPTVLEMRKYLETQQKGHNLSLKCWSSRISESSLNLLRWIIGSNRSCILQVDKFIEEQEPSSYAMTSEDRIGGMDNWVQFRFAQGAPDKEQRFLDCVKKEQTGSGNKYPTIFAWHGSRLPNWHSIVREGLRYDRVVNGRTYGDGIYMSAQANVSIGYSGSSKFVVPSHTGFFEDYTLWPNSLLKISSAFSLNEVVNRPDRFVCSKPYYVVNQIDWIQTRYLLVKAQPKHLVGNATTMKYQQDPTALAMNEYGKPVDIPISAVSKSRRPTERYLAKTKGEKRSKIMSMTDQATSESLEDDADSIVSNESDRYVLESKLESTMAIRRVHDENSNLASNAQKREVRGSEKVKGKLEVIETDFRPGTLDMSGIKVLQAPTDATPMATKALMQCFQQALKVQDTTPPHQLGWYVDPSQENLYQWIVELHSFPSSLPLAKDMKAARLTSIVLEMRFTPQFPFTPPFIRVVKPRFLPFQQGGGGHVTEGGAICMELLTNTGWSAVNSIESILLQVQMAITSEDRPARLARRPSRSKQGSTMSLGTDSYGVGEAVAAYERACRTHGWSIPPEFDKFRMDQ